MEEEAEADIEEEDATEPEPAPNKKRGRPKGLTSSKKASKTAAAANPARASTDDRNPDWQQVNEVTEDLHEPTYHHRTKLFMLVEVRAIEGDDAGVKSPFQYFATMFPWQYFQQILDATNYRLRKWKSRDGPCEGLFLRFNAL